MHQRPLPPQQYPVLAAVPKKTVFYRTRVLLRGETSSPVCSPIRSLPSSSTQFVHIVPRQFNHKQNSALFSMKTKPTDFQRETSVRVTMSTHLGACRRAADQSATAIFFSTNHRRTRSRRLERNCKFIPNGKHHVTQKAEILKAIILLSEC